MEITLEDYHETCHDGCCTTYGYIVFVDGKRLGSIEGDDVHSLADLLTHYLKCKEAGHDLTEPLDLLKHFTTTERNAFPSVNLNNTQIANNKP